MIILHMLFAMSFVVAVCYFSYKFLAFLIDKIDEKLDLNHLFFDSKPFQIGINAFFAFCFLAGGILQFKDYREGKFLNLSTFFPLSFVIFGIFLFFALYFAFRKQGQAVAVITQSVYDDFIAECGELSQEILKEIEEIERQFPWKKTVRYAPEEMGAELAWCSQTFGQKGEKWTTLCLGITSDECETAHFFFLNKADLEIFEERVLKLDLDYLNFYIK